MIENLRQMAIFAKTVDHGSFRGAARELHLSPSVVSHHISQLEEHLGTALLYRSTRKLALTREGERLLTATRRMLEAVEGELLELTATATLPSGELRLTVPSVLSRSDFINRIADFSARYPRIKLSMDFSDIRRELISDGFDIAIRMGPKAQTSATSRKLFTVGRSLVASSKYLNGRSVIAAPKDIMNHDWLSLAPIENMPVGFQHQSGAYATLKPKGQIVTNDAEALYRLARAGAGLAIVPDFLAEGDIAAGVMTHILPDWSVQPIDVYAEWPANAPRHGIVHLALNELSQKNQP